MALAATIVWEVQTGGSDNSGGGFNSSAAGTDYSQQAAAQYSGTNLTVTASNWIVTPDGHTPVAADVGNVVQVTAGTGWTVGFYEIKSQDGTNWTLDRSPAAALTAGGTWAMGGALASPGKLSDALTIDKMKAWIKSGTYTITTATVGAAGPFLGPSAIAFRIEGYTITRGDRSTKPVISAGTVGSISIFDMSSASYNNGRQFLVNVKVDGNSQISVNGVMGNAAYQSARAIDVDVINCTTGFSTVSVNNGVTCYRCTTNNCTTGFSGSGQLHYCETVGGTTGFSKSSSALATWLKCIARDCSGVGYSALTSSYGLVVDGCLAENCGSDGFKWTAYSMGMTCIDCVAVNNGGYGFNVHTGYDDNVLINCSGYNNTSGNVSGGADTEMGAFNFQHLTADPFVDTTAHDFSPNDAVGGGADLRNQTGVPGQVVQNDFGAVQHADPAGGIIAIQRPIIL